MRPSVCNVTLFKSWICQCRRMRGVKSWRGAGGQVYRRSCWQTSCMQERRYITGKRPWWHGGQRDTRAIVVSGCRAWLNVTVFSSARLATIAIGSPTHVKTRLHGHRLQNPHRNSSQKPAIRRRKLRSLPTGPIPRHHESHVTANTI